MHSTGFIESFASLAVLALMVIAAANGIKQKQRRKEMEHAERMKAFEMGLVPPPNGIDWPAASICIAIGAGVPLASFLVTWLAALTASVPHAIWLAPVFVSFAAIGSARKLAYRIIDPKSGSRKGHKGVTSTERKPAFDPDAYDVVGSRG